MKRTALAALILVTLSAGLLLVGCQGRTPSLPSSSSAVMHLPAPVPAGQATVQKTVPAPQATAVSAAEIIRQQAVLLTLVQLGEQHQWEAWQVQMVLAQQAAVQRALDNATRAQWSAQQLQQIMQQQQAIQQSLAAAQRLQQDSLRLQEVMRQQQALQQALAAAQRAQLNALPPGAPGVGNPLTAPGAPGVGNPAFQPGAPGVGNPSLPSLPRMPGPSFGGVGRP